MSVDNIVQRFPDLGDELRRPDGARGTATTAPDQGCDTARALVSEAPAQRLRHRLRAASARRSWPAGSRDAGWFSGGARRHEGAGDAGRRAGAAELEGDLVKRMHLREVLADPALASRLTPSMSLIEQLLRDKANLSGVALANAKSLIRRYVDEVAGGAAHPGRSRPARASSTGRCRRSGCSATSTSSGRSGRTSPTGARRTSGCTSTGSSTGTPPSAPRRLG